MLLFPESGPKQTFRVNGFTKAVTPHQHTYAQSFLTSNGTWPTSLLMRQPFSCLL
jgi:hypothetical protein